MSTPLPIDPLTIQSIVDLGNGTCELWTVPLPTGEFRRYLVELSADEVRCSLGWSSCTRPESVPRAPRPSVTRKRRRR